MTPPVNSHVSLPGSGYSNSGQVLSVSTIECSRSERGKLQKLGCKTHCAFLLSLGSFILGEVICHIVSSSVGWPKWQGIKSHVGELTQKSILQFQPYFQMTVVLAVSLTAHHRDPEPESPS